MSVRGGEFYAALGVAPEDDGKALKRAYRAKARETHPDAGGTDEAFALVARAYEVLSDPAERRRYDALGDAGYQSGDQVGAQARELLGRLFLEVVGQERGDLVGLLRKMLARQNEGLALEAAKLDRQIRELEAMTGRLVGGDLFDEVVRGRLREVRHDRGRVSAAQEVLDRAWEMLNGYRDLQADGGLAAVAEVMSRSGWWPDAKGYSGRSFEEAVAAWEASGRKGGQDGE